MKTSKLLDLGLKTKRHLLDYFWLTCVIGVGLFLSIMAFVFSLRSQTQEYLIKVNSQSSQVHEHISLLLTNQFLGLKHVNESQVFARATNETLIFRSESFLKESLIEAFDSLTIKYNPTLDRMQMQVYVKESKNSFDSSPLQNALKRHIESLSSLPFAQQEVIVLPYSEKEDQWYLGLLWKIQNRRDQYWIAWLPIEKLLSQELASFEGGVVFENQALPHSPRVKAFFRPQGPIIKSFSPDELQNGKDIIWLSERHSDALGANFSALYFALPKSSFGWSWVVLLSGILIAILISLLVYGLINRNIDIQNQVELKTRDLERAVDKARRATESKNRFLANMSHEIRTPLNIISGVMDLLKEYPISKEQMKLLETGQRSSHHLLSLIEDILDMVRMEAGDISFENQPFNVSDLLHEVSSFGSITASGKDLGFSFYIDPQLPSVLKGDAKRIRQVLLNLINNSIKFTDKGFVNLEVYEEKRDLPNNKAHLCFKISDSGIGIAPEDQNKIFSEFIQVDPSSTRNKGGVGLGLAIVRTIVQKLGGQVEVKSTQGVGSQFFVRISFDVENGNAWISQWRNKFNLSNKKILLAAKDPLELKYLSECLSHLGADVFWSHFEEEEIPPYSSLKGKYDYLFIDFDLSKHCFRSPPSETPHSPEVVVFMEEHQNGETTKKLESLKLTRHVVRPITIGNLLSTLLDEKKSAKSSREHANHLSSDKTILIVEDDEDNRNLLQAFLAHLPVQCVYAKNGHEALELFFEMNPQIVVTDIQMPGMDGFELSRKLRKLEESRGLQASVILALTADAMPEQIALAEEAGINEYLTKPISKDRLIQSLSRAASQIH